MLDLMGAASGELQVSELGSAPFITRGQKQSPEGTEGLCHPLLWTPPAFVSSPGPPASAWVMLDGHLPFASPDTTDLDSDTSQPNLGPALSPWASMAGTGLSRPDPALTACLNLVLPHHHELTRGFWTFG